MEVSGETYEGEEEVKGAIVQFYEQLSIVEANRRPYLGCVDFNQIGGENSEWS